MSDGSMSYIGRVECGCIKSAHVDRPEYRKEIAKFCAEVIREGETLERVPTEYVRENWDCETHRKVSVPQSPTVTE